MLRVLHRFDAHSTHRLSCRSTSVGHRTSKTAVLWCLRVRRRRRHQLGEARGALNHSVHADPRLHRRCTRPHHRHVLRELLGMKHHICITVMHDVSNLTCNKVPINGREAQTRDGANPPTQDPLNAVLRVDSASHNVVGQTLRQGSEQCDHA